MTPLAYRSESWRTLGVVVALLAAQPSTSQAQVSAFGPDPAAMFKRLCEDLDALESARIAFLEAKVRPTPEQKNVWDTFIATIRTAEAPLRARCQAGPPPPPNLLEPLAALAERNKIMSEMASVHSNVQAAVAKVMPILNPEQQRALATAMLAPPMGLPHAPPFGPPRL